MATEFTLTDGSGQYGWIWENVDLADYDDEDIESLVSQHLENAVDLYKSRVEEQAASKKYPVYGSSTTDLLEDEEAYIAYVLADLEDEIAVEKAAAIEAVKQAKMEVENHTFTVTIGNNTFEIEGIEFMVIPSRYNSTEFTVEIDGGYGIADYEDGLQNWVEIDGNFEVKTFETAQEIDHNETEFEVTITAEELARAKEYRANYPVEIKN
jgi:hypothetical protein